MASPWRRLVALLIDLLLVAMLSGAPGELLAFLVAFIIFRASNRKPLKTLPSGRVVGRKRRFIVRLLAAFVILIVLLVTLPQVFKGDNSYYNPGDNNQDTLTTEQKVELAIIAAVAANKMEQSDCQQDLSCWEALLQDDMQHPASMHVDDKVVKEGLEDIINETPLSKEDKKSLAQTLYSSYKKFQALEQTSNPVVDEEQITTATPDAAPEQVEEKVLNKR